MKNKWLIAAIAAGLALYYWRANCPSCSGRTAKDAPPDGASPNAAGKDRGQAANGLGVYL